MADKKITELTELTTPASADVVAIVDDPSGTPTTKKITYSNIESNLSISASQVSDFDAEVNNNGSVVLNTTHRTGDGADHADVATNTTDITNLSGVVVAVSGATVTNAGNISTNTTNITNLSGVVVSVSGATVTNAGNISDNTTNITNLSGVVETVSGAGATHEADSTIHFTQAGISIPASQISDFDAEVNNNGSVVSNTSHRTGDGSDHADVSSNTTNITNLSGVVVDVSGATVTNSGNITTNTNNITNLSGVVVDISGATVTNSGDITNLSGVVVSVSGAGATHEADSSDPHGATLTQTNVSSTGLISGTTLTTVVGDHGNASGAEVINVSYGTSGTPPTASDTTEGSLYVQYTA